tara:strand:- start:1548 stop:2018 length:471 start_codon:yes stop_codon:yes gene_type:complete
MDKEHDFDLITKIFGTLSFGIASLTLVALLMWALGYENYLTGAFIVQPAFTEAFVSYTAILASVIYAYAGLLFLKKHPRIVNFVFLGFIINIIYSFYVLVAHLAPGIFVAEFGYFFTQSLIRVAVVGLIYYYLLQNREYLIQKEDHESVSQNQKAP